MIYFYTNPTDRVWADSALKILHFQRQMFLFGFPSLKRKRERTTPFTEPISRRIKQKGRSFSAALLFQQKQEVLYDGKVAPYGNLFQYSQRIRLWMLRSQHPKGRTGLLLCSPRYGHPRMPPVPLRSFKANSQESSSSAGIRSGGF